jgi:hypothetical protein
VPVPVRDPQPSDARDEESGTFTGTGTRTGKIATFEYRDTP